MLYILLAILFFGFLIAVHEFGHFMTAKLSGVKVNEFSIGMGPQLLKSRERRRSIPFVCFPSAVSAPWRERMNPPMIPAALPRPLRGGGFLILVAGSATNFLVGILILLCLFSTAKSTAVPTISSFADGCPAYTEGYLQPGDTLLKINGHRVLVYNDVTTLLSRGNGSTVDLVIRRDRETLKLKNVPVALGEYPDGNGGTTQRYGINFSVAESTFASNMGTALRTGADFVRMVWFGLEDLFSGAAGLKDMSGPIGIVNTMSQVGEQSDTAGNALLNLLYFGAFIAVNLAVMNLLPLPALDGGRIFFLVLNVILSKVIHREIPGKYEGYVHMAGMALLLALMLVVGINDVYRLIGR